MTFHTLQQLKRCHLESGFRLARRLSLFLVVSTAGFILNDATAQPANRWWSDAVEQALTQAGTNRQELVNALDQTPAGRRDGMQFLLENAPPRDLRTLSAGFLLENLALAYDAYEKAAWHDRVPTEIFLNDVLPYASANETREGWRKVLGEKFAPLVENCKTPAEAAHLLNRRIFRLVNVKYSTERRKADQSPSESMQSGLASCTGLSILLIDACRSVGVPARLVGTPMWSNMRGNHTWVEIWDGGWHFAGAAEPDSKGLDHAWFEHDASEAVKDVPEHAIYASSFKKTGLAFPMDWAPNVQWVSAINVTERYTSKAASAAAGKVRLLVKVLDPAGQRVAAQVTVTDATNSAVHFGGTSRGESADMNDILAVEIPRSGVYKIRAELGGLSAEREFSAGTNAQELIVISLGGPPSAKPLKPGDEAELKKALTEFFTAPAEKQAGWKFSGSLEKLLLENESGVRQAAWEAYEDAAIHDALKQDFDAKQARFEKYLSPYTVKTVGERPANGWALFIAMHGGGSGPKEVNDSQWQVMQRYYRDHPEAGGYIYLALRAPNDTWNGFYDVYVYPLIANLVHQFLLFGDVNPDKVFIMGYSHGGYGAFAIGPKEPDLFAAIHASAGAPTDGETTGRTLRNTVFTCMVGELDTAYGRISRDRKFQETIEQLRGDRTDIYPVTVKVILGNGHTGLPDRDKIKEMYPAVRNTVPRELTWLMTDKVIKDFFWLHTDAPGKKKEIDATCRDNHLTVATTNVAAASVLLDSRLVDFMKPVTLELDGQTTTQKLQPSLRTLCETLQRRGDPELAFTVEITLPLVPPPPAQ